MNVQSYSGTRVLVLPLVSAILADNVAAGGLEEKDFVTLLSSAGKLGIVRHPPADDHTPVNGRMKITSLPSCNADKPKHF